MSFDGFFTHALVEELKNQFVGSKVMKIYQPFEQELQIVLRANRQNRRLAFSIHPQYYRLHETVEKPNNPEHAPMFCMLMRKHLENAIILDIRQVDNDRIVEFDLTGRDELGDAQIYRLIIELMGRHSNLLLVNGKGVIIDCMKHVNLSQNAYRSLQPGGMYLRPPVRQEQVNIWQEAIPSDLNIHQLGQAIQGMGAFASQAIRDEVERGNELKDVLENFKQAVQQGPATLYHLENQRYAFYCCSLPIHTAKQQTFTTLSKLVSDYYQEKVRIDRIKQMTGDLSRHLKQLIDRHQQKLAKLQGDRQIAEAADEYRVKGELLTAYSYQVAKGATSISLPNYYADEQLLVIELNPRKTAIENSQHYFKQYMKYREALQYIETQEQQAMEALHYLETVLMQLEHADLEDVEPIKQELMEQGYSSKKQQSLKKRAKIKGNAPREFQATDGTKIYVGRNNQQNDELSLKQAAKDYWWFHAKNIPGSHVIVASSQLTDQTRTEAAEIAAYYSKFQHSANVPVDMIQVKHLRKPNGAKPGFVVYEGQTTLFVTPDSNKIQQRMVLSDQ